MKYVRIFVLIWLFFENTFSEYCGYYQAEDVSFWLTVSRNIEGEWMIESGIEYPKNTMEKWSIVFQNRTNSLKNTTSHKVNAMVVPKGYQIYSNGKIYKFNTNREKWIIAKKECEKSFGYLAIPQDNEDKKIIENFTVKYDYPIWVGINYNKKEDVYLDLFGNENKLWKTSLNLKPNVSEMEYCGFIYSNNIKKTFVGVKNCDAFSPYICQFDNLLNSN